jgi:hypothetical protein
MQKLHTRKEINWLLLMMRTALWDVYPKWEWNLNCLFDLLTANRYERFAQKNSWNFEILDITESEMRGYKVCTTHNSPSSII